MCVVSNPCFIFRVSLHAHDAHHSFVLVFYLTYTLCKAGLNSMDFGPLRTAALYQIATYSVGCSFCPFPRFKLSVLRLWWGTVDLGSATPWIASKGPKPIICALD